MDGDHSSESRDLEFNLTGILELAGYFAMAYWPPAVPAPRVELNSAPMRLCVPRSEESIEALRRTLELAIRNPGIIAESASAFLSELDGTWARFKECGGEDCRSVFWDRSKNRSGRWCTMKDCGNRAMVRASRERERSSA